MNGVMMPETSAGSNQTGASETCTAQVSCPSAAAALATRVAAPNVATPTLAAAPPTKPRRVIVSSVIMHPRPSAPLRVRTSEFLRKGAGATKATAPTNTPEEARSRRLECQVRARAGAAGVRLLLLRLDRWGRGLLLLRLLVFDGGFRRGGFRHDRFRRDHAGEAFLLAGFDRLGAVMKHGVPSRVFVSVGRNRLPDFLTIGFGLRRCAACQ